MQIMLSSLNFFISNDYSSIKIDKASSSNIKNYLSDASKDIKGLLHFLQVRENKVSVIYVKHLKFH